MIERTRFTTYLADLESTLGLMHQLVAGVRAMDGDSRELARVLEIADTLAQQRPGLMKLPEALRDTYGAISGALGDIRVSRETIRVHALDRLQRTHERLAEVTSATESATTRLLDGLDRALGMIDRLESLPGDGPRSTQLEVRAVAQELRREVTGLFEVLQFQDITAQQLGAAGDLLAGVEHRLQGVASLFDPDASPGERQAAALDAPATGPQVYDANASTRDGAARQVLVDTILAEVARTAPAAVAVSEQAT